ncbi:hypothetical protein HKD37_20G057878 [Glycine soja]
MHKYLKYITQSSTVLSTVKTKTFLIVNHRHGTDKMNKYDASEHQNKAGLESSLFPEFHPAKVRQLLVYSLKYNQYACTMRTCIGPES